MHLYICIVAPHLGTLDVQRVDVKYAVLEPNHKMVLKLGSDALGVLE